MFWNTTSISMIDIWIRTITVLEPVLYLLYSNTTYEFHGYTIKQRRLTYPSFLSYKDSYKIFYNLSLELAKSPIVRTKRVLRILVGLLFYKRRRFIRLRVNHHQIQLITSYKLLQFYKLYILFPLLHL